MLGLFTYLSLTNKRKCIVGEENLVTKKPKKIEKHELSMFLPLEKPKNIVGTSEYLSDRKILINFLIRQLETNNHVR